MRTLDVARRPNPRHRQTLVGRGVGRAAGFYEQCDHRDLDDGPMPLHAAQSGSITAYGMVGRSCRLGHHVLRSIAGSDHLSDFDARVVPIANLLSEIRLDARADLVMWHGLNGSRIATPVARLFDDAGAVLVLGGTDISAHPRWSEPVILRTPNLATSRGEMEVVALTAMTFDQFVGGRR